MSDDDAPAPESRGVRNPSVVDLISLDSQSDEVVLLMLELLKRRDKIKVFHAGKQDLEILFRLTGEVVQPMFDTQVAASMVGWGAQISFAKIVKKVTGKIINKSETYTDWCRRPLRQSQID